MMALIVKEKKKCKANDPYIADPNINIETNLITSLSQNSSFSRKFIIF